ncbi:MAG: 5'-nucleotidase [Firmicutes bacterium ADurb.Bin300]|nr:MAG: 5'-nucleotidase [Firmicutes bacterium ADurb.Bin300]
MYDIVLWDWNGTLLDDCETALCCVNEMLDEMGESHIDLEKYYSLVDTPIIKFYIGLLRTDKLDFDKISRDYHRAYNKRIHDIGLMQGAREILEHNRSLGITQVIITSAQKSDVQKLVRYYGIEEYFKDIIGASDKLAAQKITRALEYFEENKLDRKTAIMVGDTLHDLDTANALCIECALITKGHQGEKILKNAGCIVINSLYELSKIIKGERTEKVIYPKGG